MEDNNKQEVMIKASNNSCLTKEMLTEIWYMKGLMGIYNLGLEMRKARNPISFS